MRAAIVIVATALASAACSGGRDGATPPPSREKVLAIVWNDEGGDLVELEAGSFRPMTPPVSLGDYAGPWALSPNGTRLAIASTRMLRLIDLERVQSLGDVEKPGRDVYAMVWADAHRVLLASAAWNQKGVELAAIDFRLRRVTSQAHVPGGYVTDWSRARDALVLLITPAQAMGSTRLLVFDADGRIRVVSLARIPSGSEADELARGLRVDRYATPGLAVDEEDGRLFVVSPHDDVIAEVDLASLQVSYHSLQREISLLERLRDWIEPSAEAKGASDGSARRAWWLGSGRLAVTGFNEHAFLDKEGTLQQRSTPAGLRLINTEDWSVRMLDAKASAAAVAGDTVLGFGSYYQWESRQWVGAGVSGYSDDGDRRFHLFGNDPVWDVQVVGALAYAAFENSSRAALVDVASGRLVRMLDTAAVNSWPSLLRLAPTNSSSR
ncbi:MAG: hypothetical protein ACRDNG_12905 [Gaiellaceae bacterium]